MRIVSARIENYKSFLHSPEVQFSPGFNVIVGRNNVGKTALVQALSMRVDNRPHRSLRTAVTRLAALNTSSSVDLRIAASGEEIRTVLRNGTNQFWVPTYNTSSSRLPMPHESAARFEEIIAGSGIIRAVFMQGTVQSAYHERYGLLLGSTEGVMLSIDRSSGEMVPGDTRNVDSFQSVNFSAVVAVFFQNNTYLFKAERMNVGEYSIGEQSTLNSDASNLALVLHCLQSSNSARYQRLIRHVKEVFPEIKHVTVPVAGNNVRILIWSVDPETERDDLAMPLSESGTGIGQVLAILYVIVTSDESRVIIIDEPQSFLHPGAIRKLIEVLRHYSQHQYIITTHSPTVVTAARPETLLLMQKQDAESVIEPIDAADNEHLRLFLTEIGSSLADVFGADKILWVEGPTEETCFPLIWQSLDSRPLMGTVIIGVLHTADFENKKKELALQVYNRLSKGRGLLPPAVGFIFDREGRSDRDIADLQRMGETGGVAVSFLPRRMYENYLLNPNALAAVMSALPNFSDAPVTAAEVEVWLQEHKWDRVYFERSYRADEQDDATWLREVHAAKLLKAVFSHFAKEPYEYDKVEHGYALTLWLVMNAPNDLQDVVQLIAGALERSDAQA